MLYKLTRIDKKSDNWIVASLIEVSATPGKEPARYLQVSINKTDKKTGTVNFPQFDDLQVGDEIEGNLWQNPSTSNWSLYPVLEKANKPRGGANSSFKSHLIKEAQDTKREDIKSFQSHKESSIKLASAQRDSVLIVCEILKQTPFPTDEEIKKMVIEWRNWFLVSSEFNDNIPPFE